eukprot:TRINITY_DN609_c0_g3_i1.p1 TRINITY_DN609_c0_g3~~TRINITY_DN609_c0_g3_i1.p1  ORF type:complete len:568 (+),score=253.49 TRINITY_DN609_c0_g3_i1:37-1740(+)
MKFIVGADTGLAKVCEVERKTIQGKWGDAEKGAAVDAMCWADLPPSSGSTIFESKVYVAMHRSIPLLQPKDEIHIKSEESEALEEKPEVENLGEWENEEKGEENQVERNQLPYMQKYSTKSVVSLWDSDQDITYPHSIEVDGFVRGIHVIHSSNSSVESSDSSDKNRKLLIGNDSGSFELYSTEGDRDPYSLVSQFNACSGHQVSRFRVNQYKSSGEIQFAFGGVKNELQIFDFESKKSIFEAKNVKPDKLWRVVPIWVSDLGFVDENRIATSTGHHQVRLYDIKAQRRPVADFVVSKYPVMCMLVSKDGNSVYAADTTGTINEWDFRKTKTPIRGFAGNTGSVRGMALHPTIPAIISVGLDRFARVYSTKTSRVESKLYMKQKMNCVLWSSEPRRRIQSELKEKKKRDALIKEDGELFSDDEDDDVWDSIPTVGGKRNNKSTRKIDLEALSAKKAIQVSDEDESDEEEGEDAMEEDEEDDEGDDDESDEEEEEEGEDEMNSDDSSDDSDEDEPPKKKGKNGDLSKKPAPQKPVSARTLDLKQKLKIAIARKKLEQSQKNRKGYKDK